MKLLKGFKSLPKGTKRLIVVLSFIIPLIVSCLLSMPISNPYWIPASIILMPIYWTAIFAGLWVYLGFKEDQEREKKPIL